jgi:hypothetical protein
MDKPMKVLAFITIFSIPAVILGMAITSLIQDYGLMYTLGILAWVGAAVWAIHWLDN